MANPTAPKDALVSHVARRGDRGDDRGGHLERRVTVLDAVAARDPGEVASAGTGLTR
jgi:hypothetical protein